MFLDPAGGVSHKDMIHLNISNLINLLTNNYGAEEVDILKDASDFKNLTDFEKHIFTSNLKRQILLDSVQAILLQFGFFLYKKKKKKKNIELETWIETWAFSETIPQ